MKRRALILAIISLSSHVAAQVAADPQPSSLAAAASPARQPEATDDDWDPATAAVKLKAATPPYPWPVRRALAIGRRECGQEGGSSFTYRDGIVRKGDLDGDGRDDFVVDFREARCAERRFMFTGTGGWDLDIFIAQPKGQFAWVFSNRVRDYDLSDGRGPRTMTFHLHGGYCGLAGADDCVKTRKMSARGFEFRDR